MNRSTLILPGVLAAVLLFGACTARGSLDPTDGDNPPPLAGTIFLEPNLIRETDPTTFTDSSIVFLEQAPRSVFDRRVDDYVTINAFVFDVTYSDGITMEAQVNPEFGSETNARQLVETYAGALGRIPAALREGVDTLWINDGVHPLSGTDGALLIHVGQAFQYEFQDYLDEVLLHEAVHSALDVPHATSPGWIAAQEADPNFISANAKAFPEVEDLAESFSAWVISEYLTDRLETSLINLFRQTIPNRLDYLDGLNLDMTPIQ